jgi:hypothetical protein
MGTLGSEGLGNEGILGGGIILFTAERSIRGRSSMGVVLGIPRRLALDKDVVEVICDEFNIEVAFGSPKRLALDRAAGEDIDSRFTLGDGTSFILLGNDI